jgi:hypothetical protein
MELYVLDSLWRPVQVIDKFQSLIWTERHRDIGDFELDIQANLNSRGLLAAGVYLAMNESYRVMKVETVNDTVDTDGRQILKVTGRSMERILLNRVARNTTADTTVTPKWLLSGPPMTIARTMFHAICVLGQFSTRDIIPGIIETSLFPADTIGEPSASISIEVSPTTLHAAIKALADAYEFGYRFTRDPNVYQMHFDIYTGSDRTTQQSTLPAVVFSPELDNLQNTSSLTTIYPHKNVAYVISPNGVKVVYPDAADDTLITGYDRDVLLVEANDVTETNPTLLDAKLTQLGKQALLENRQFSAFDGEITQHSNYKYGRDYNLGDLVEIRNKTGTTNQMQVTEQIFVSDSEGERSYPTLSLNTFILPGTWLAWDYNQVWLDLDSDPQTWADQP